MTTTRKLEIAFLCVVAFIAICLGASSVRKAHENDELRATAARDAATAKSVTDAKDAAIADRNKVAAQQDAKITELDAAVKSTPQAATAIVKFFPVQEQQPIATMTRGELPASVQADLPDAPSYGVMTGDQLLQVAHDEASCAIARNDLAACRANFADRTTELAATAKALDSTTVAMKQGTKAQRFFRPLKLAACGSGGGAAGAALRGKAQDAAIGAAVAVLICSTFQK